MTHLFFLGGAVNQSCLSPRLVNNETYQAQLAILFSTEGKKEIHAIFSMDINKR